MNNRSCLSIVLAAGEGTRMKSDMSKVLHPVAGLPMVCHVGKTARDAGGDALSIVVGRGKDQVAEALSSYGVDAQLFEQTERLGTAHAVLAARPSLEENYDDVLVMFGDTPLVDAEALSTAREALAEGAAVVVMGFKTDNPTGYGRLIEKDGQLLAIREEKEASEDEKKITFCNGGLMAIAGAQALSLIDAVKNDNAKGEYYLTDIAEIAQRAGQKVVAVEVAFDNVLGVNTRVELAEAEAIWQQRQRKKLMLEGVSMQAPETVFLHHDTHIEAGVIIEPNVYFGPKVSVAAGAKIRGFSHLEGATIGAGAEIGPFARLRPGAELAEGSKVGNFCEVKKAKIGEGAKVNHLTYIGDAIIGAKANIGAGTITCNYDGFNKHLTQIGEGAFVGSNSSLIAPVTLGDGAYVASGSVVTMDVPADALAFGRSKQRNKEGYGETLRNRLAAEKAAKATKKS